MEKNWLARASDESKKRIGARRYMDDILMCYKRDGQWDHETFLSDFERSDCYHPPLKLEDGKEGTFLETTFKWENGRYRYWLKNDNEIGEEPKIWRYKEFRSHAPYAQKRALITMMMRKVHKMASDREALRQSASQKLEEFKRLGYPEGLLKGVCNFMGATTGNGEWITVRNSI